MAVDSVRLFVLCDRLFGFITQSIQMHLSMKRFLYILCVAVSLSGLDACKKSSDPEPVAPVVGKWTLGRVRFSGYPAPFTALNADRPSSAYGLSGSFNVKSDKSFTETVNNGTRVTDFKGTWDFTSNTLQLKYDDSSTEDYQLDAAQDPSQLISSAVSDTVSLRATATSPFQVVRYKYQFVYTK